MTTAVSEILKQVEWLSVEEKLTLTATLIEQMQPNDDTRLQSIPGNEPPANHKPRDISSLKRRLPEESYEPERQFADGGTSGSARDDISDIFGDDADGIPDAFELNRAPPKRTYTIRGRFQFLGRATPLPLELDEDE
jgi:hypothetical protein